MLRFLKPETPLYFVGLMVAALIICLVIVILWSVFQEGLPSLKTVFEFSLDNFHEVFSSPLLPKGVLNTLLLGLGSTAVSLLVAIPLTWLVHRTTLRFKQTSITVIFLTSLLPGFVMIMGWIMLLGPHVGLINQALRLVIPVEAGPLSPYNIPFMIFLQGISSAPVLFLMLGGAFMAIDPSLEESAEASGMSKFQVFRHISLPLLKPSIVAGALFVLMMALSSFEIPALLGAPVQIHVFATIMFDAVQPDVGLPQYGVAGLYAVIMLIPTLAALFYYQKMIKLSHRYATVTGKGYRPKLTDLGSWTWAGYAFIILFFILVMVLPLLAVIWTSLLPIVQMPSAAALENISLDGYSKAFDVLVSQGAIRNTLILIFSVGFSGMLIGLIISWITVRTRMPGRFALDTIAMVPHVIPGIAIAFAVAFMGILLIKVVPLYGSLAAIIIANVVRSTPFTTRTMNSSLIQIHPELEEAVQTSGASKVVALRKVIVPLITPALSYCFIWPLLHSYKEVTLPLFLISPRNIVLSTAVWTQWGQSRYDVATACSVIMMGVMAVFIVIALRVFPQIRRAM